MIRPLLALGCVGLVGLAACDGDDSSGTPDVVDDGSTDGSGDAPEDGVEDSTAPDEPIGPDGYPPEPYGVVPGTRIENLQFVSSEDTRVQLSDFYNDLSVKLLWIYDTAGWCPSCGVESSAMPDLYTEYHPQGLDILAVVFENASGAPATVSYAAGYKENYGFQFTTVADQPFVTGRYFDEAATPMNMLVDLTDMEILSIDMGWNGSTFTNAIEVNLFQIADRE